MPSILPNQILVCAITLSNFWNDVFFMTRGSPFRQDDFMDNSTHSIGKIFLPRITSNNNKTSHRQNNIVDINNQNPIH